MIGNDHEKSKSIGTHAGKSRQCSPVNMEDLKVWMEKHNPAYARAFAWKLELELGARFDSPASNSPSIPTFRPPSFLVFLVLNILIVHI